MPIGAKGYAQVLVIDPDLALALWIMKGSAGAVCAYLSAEGLYDPFTGKPYRPHYIYRSAYQGKYYLENIKPAIMEARKKRVSRFERAAMSREINLQHLTWAVETYENKWEEFKKQWFEYEQVLKVLREKNILGAMFGISATKGYGGINT